MYDTECCKFDFLDENSTNDHYIMGYNDGCKAGEQDGFERGQKFKTMDVRNAYPCKSMDKCDNYSNGYTEGYFQKYYPAFAEAHKNLAHK